MLPNTVAPGQPLFGNILWRRHFAFLYFYDSALFFVLPIEHLIPIYSIFALENIPHTKSVNLVSKPAQQNKFAN